MICYIYYYSLIILSTHSHLEFTINHNLISCYSREKILPTKSTIMNVNPHSRCKYCKCKTIFSSDSNCHNTCITSFHSPVSGTLKGEDILTMNNSSSWSFENYPYLYLKVPNRLRYPQNLWNLSFSVLWF